MPSLLFAYGALLDPAVHARRGLPRLPPPTPAVAPGRALAFAHRGGYATLVPEARAAAWRGAGGGTLVSPAPAHGAVFSLQSSQALAVLAAREGGYRLTEIDVLPYGGAPTPRRALAFLTSPGLTMIGGPLPPRAAYAAKLRAGAAAAGLEDGWVAWLAAVATLDDGPPLPPAYGDTVAGRVAGVGAGVALVAAGVVAAAGGG